VSGACSNPAARAVSPKASRPITLDVSSEFVEMVARRAAEIVAAGQSLSPWLDTKGAAEYLACEPARIHDLVALKRLHPRRDGRRLLFKSADLDDYLESSA
jgi:excisionase family DNA binding protein